MVRPGVKGVNYFVSPSSATNDPGERPDSKILRRQESSFKLQKKQL